MRNPIMKLAAPLAALMAVALVFGGACSSPAKPVASAAPVVDTLTADQIVGRYYGQVTIDNYEANTRNVYQGSATITATATPLDSSTCECVYSINIDTRPNSSFTDLFYTAGHPLKLERECSSNMFHFKFTGKCDGKTLSGIHDQYRLADDGSVGTHMFTLSFTATRH